jgi:uncharacterized protein
MVLDALIDGIGEEWVETLGGLVIGTVFGLLAQRTRFCLRAASLETGAGRPGDRLAVWLLVFATALVGTQALVLLDLFDTGTVRALNNRGSLSGAVIGGLMFGSGMVLTRACATRMLVLSATGNLRALLSGLVFVVTAQAARSGLLEPARAAVNGWWTVDAGWRNLLVITGIGHWGGLLFGLAWLFAGLVLAVRTGVRRIAVLGAAGVGATVVAAWWFTFTLAGVSFDPVSVHALNFTAPSADVLMYVLSPPGGRLTFDIGLIPGVVLGAFLGGLYGGEMRLEGFDGGAGMRRYILGGLMMGFGGVLAGGCAVGAGVSGASVFALTAWLVLWSMWFGAVATDRLVDAPARQIRGETVGAVS